MRGTSGCLGTTFSEISAARSRAIIKTYLISHPEVLEEAMAELNKRQAAAEDAKHEASIEQNSDAIFNSPRNVTLGNKGGDVTFVEFFDYNCGYCKRAMSDMLDLMKSDPKLKVVLKEYSGTERRFGGSGKGRRRRTDAGSRWRQISRLPPEAARRPGTGPIKHGRSRQRREAGLDLARIETDMASPEARATIEENFKLAEAMGMNGTPSYVIGSRWSWAPSASTV